MPPFIVIYLHNVRGISFAEAWLALAFGGVAALATGWVAGSTVDRIGGRNTLLLGLTLQAVVFSLVPLIREAWHALPSRCSASRAPAPRVSRRASPRCSPG